ncbi:Uncharacterised protein [Nocardia africana]|uniref:Uncharacterized protein n=1 Tax=Nocardia africana TaxID=134964 RepID=A0A378WQ34_9NOCA|nr:Uncharacterised protein [Nocardia africana]
MGTTARGEPDSAAFRSCTDITAARRCRCGPPTSGTTWSPSR